MKELQPQVTHGLPATNDSDLIIDTMMWASGVS